MLQANKKRMWNKNTAIITILVAIFGATSILYTANNYLNEQFVSAILPKEPFANSDTKIYPWGTHIQDTATESQDIVSNVVDVKQRISEIDKKIMQNIKDSKSNVSLFEEKGDLLMKLGQYEAAVAHYEEAYDSSLETRILDKMLLAEKMLNRVQMISK